MPSVSISQRELFKRLGRSYRTEELEGLCFQFGIELDDIQKQQDDNLLKIDVPANRYDLLCIEGIARALAIFLHPNPQSQLPKFSTLPHKYTVNVSPSVSGIRPYICCAILRNVTLSSAALASFIELQDKLHHTMCRRRALASIGTYDLSKVNGTELIYTALPPEQVSFQPLSCPDPNVKTGPQVLEYLSSHLQLKQYLPLVTPFPQLTVFLDQAKAVLSLPPLINAEASKLTTESRDVLIDCTSTDYRRGELVLNTIVAMFSEYCANPFEVEQVKIVYQDSDKRQDATQAAKDAVPSVYPSLSGWELPVDLSYVRRIIGRPDFTAKQVLDALYKMQIDGYLDPKDSTLCIAKIPITRSDIMHTCDIAEDVAISIGYQELKAPALSMTQRQPMAVLSESVRESLAAMGYNECLTFALCSHAENYSNLKRALPKSGDSNQWNPLEYQFSVQPVELANAKTREFTETRAQLISGVLKSISANIGRREMPLRLFEVGDIIVLDSNTQVGSRNLRYCCVAYADEHSSGLEDIHGVLDALLLNMGFVGDYVIAENKNTNKSQITADGESSSQWQNLERFQQFSLIPSDSELFLPGRQVQIMAQNPQNATQKSCIGVFGTIHADVLKAFGLHVPVSLLEITLEPFVKWMHPTDLIF